MRNAFVFGILIGLMLILIMAISDLKERIAKVEVKIEHLEENRKCT